MLRFNGALGTVIFIIGRLIEIMLDAVPSPDIFTALIFRLYVKPFVNPVICIGDVF